jgi:methionine biosynthesis protein MetW
MTTNAPSHTATRYREIFDRGMSATQKQTIDWVPQGARVLELGCSSGYIGQLLQEEKGCQVTGVEIDEAAAVEARGRGLDVRVGSLESKAFRDSIQGPFDVVLANDVLEHLLDPEPVLAQMRRWLTPLGSAVISTPNVASWLIRSKLFFGGDFRYEETGVMDRTHVHFFTWETFHEMLERQRFEVLERTYESYELPFTMHLAWWWPEAKRIELESTLESKPLPARLASRVAVKLLYKIIVPRQRVGFALARRFPNLCSPHIAVLVRPL